MNNKYDLIIVGAGPSGVFTAYELIELGFSPVQIAERLGHESATITMRYAHLYPSVQVDMAEKLDAMFQEYEMEDDEEEDID